MDHYCYAVISFIGCFYWLVFVLHFVRLALSKKEESELLCSVRLLSCSVE